MNKKEWIDKLHYDFDKQQNNLELAYLTKNGPKWKNWKSYIEVQSDPKLIEQANNRSILPNECVIDIEDKNDFQKITETIKREFQFYSIYDTGSRGIHTHLFFDGELTPEEKNNIINRYGGDKQKSSKRNLIALDGCNCPHWKTGKPKTLIEESQGFNSIVDERKRQETEKVNVTSIIHDEENELRESVIELIESRDVTGACHELASHLLRKYHILTFSDTNEIYIYQSGVYTTRGEEIIQREIQQILRNYCKLHLVNEVVGHIKRSTIVNRSIIKEPIDKICLQNGILDLNTLEISIHDPAIIFFNKLPIAHLSTADCPKIKKFLAEVIDKDSISLIQEFFGYCLYKEHFIHKAFMLVGSGANGKSTLLRLLKSFLGADNVTSIPLQSLENNRFAISSLFSKLANVFADLSSRALSGTSIFKMLVGQDLIPAEKKFRDQFFFENYAKLIFSANQIPKSPEDSDAFFRRWVIINFPNQFLKNADKHLVKKLTSLEEMSGLLNFAIEGLKRLMENGDFSNSQSIEQVREQYIRMSDSVGAFVMDAVLASPDENVTKEEIYLAYCDYCKERGYPIVTNNTFHKGLVQNERIRVKEARLYKIREGKKERVQCWEGITINKITLKLEKKSDMVDSTDIKDRNCQGSQGCQPDSLLRSQLENEDVNPVRDVKPNSLLEVASDINHIEVIKISSLNNSKGGTQNE